MDLISRAQAGDREAFAALFEQYKNMVYKTAYLIIGNARDAEDALQEVFLAVHKSLASFDPRKGAFTTWLYRITLNFCLNHRRKRQHASLEDVSPRPATNFSGARLAEEQQTALVEASNGKTYVIDSTLPRDTIKAFAEELELVK